MRFNRPWCLRKLGLFLRSPLRSTLFLSTLLYWQALTSSWLSRTMATHLLVTSLIGMWSQR